MLSDDFQSGDQVEIMVPGPHLHKQATVVTVYYHAVVVQPDDGWTELRLTREQIQRYSPVIKEAGLLDSQPWPQLAEDEG